MLDQWKTFLLTNQNAIIEAYSDAFLPRLAGLILYHVHHSESFYEIDQREFNESATQSDEESSLRSVSTHRHGEMNFYFYTRRLVNPLDLVSSWFKLHQFEEHLGKGDWNLPCTWNDLVLDWVQMNRDFEVMDTILDPIVPPALLKAFAKDFVLNKTLPHENLWYHLCLNDSDNGRFAEFIMLMETSVLEKIARFTIGALDEAYPWFYRSHKTAVEKQAYQMQIRAAKMKEHEMNTRALAMKLLPEFHKRLRANFDIIVPQLRFAKDLDIWPILLQTLKTFSPQEQAAILFVSNCSKGIREELIRAV